MKNITIDSTRCGGGKTTSIVKEAKMLYDLGESVLIIQPAINLIDETASHLPMAHAIHNQNTKNVSAAIKYFSSQTNVVIIITHVAFMMNDFPVGKFILLQDEEINPHNEVVLNLPDTYDVLPLSDWFKTEACTTLDGSDELSENYLSLVPNNVYSLVSGVDSKDDVLHLFKDITNAVLSNDYDVYITKNMADKMVNSKGQMIAQVVINKHKYEGFKGVGFFGAMIDRSLLVKTIGLPYTLVKGKGFTKHDGKLVTIHAGENEGISKHLIDARPEIKHNFLRYVKEKVQRKQYLYIDNNCQQDQEGETRLSHNVHGVNKHRDSTNVVLMSAINPTPSACKFLKEMCGMGNYDIKRHYMVNLYYQVALRTAIRNHDNNKKVNIFCLDGLVANFLAFEYFDDATLVKVEGTERVAKRTFTKAENNKLKKITEAIPEFVSMEKEYLLNPSIYAMLSARGKIKREMKYILEPFGKTDAERTQAWIDAMVHGYPDWVKKPDSDKYSHYYALRKGEVNYDGKSLIGKHDENY